MPKFESFDEVVEFFDEHDAAPYLDELEDVTAQFQMGPEQMEEILHRGMERYEKRLLSLRLERRQIDEARRIAQRKGLGYQTLMRVWIQEGIDREKKAG